MHHLPLALLLWLSAFCAAPPGMRSFGAVLPAHGIHARHVRDVRFKHVELTVKSSDARPANIFIDVEGVTPADFAPVPATTE